MIGVRCKTYRLSQRAKVADFAKLIGISQGSLSDIENNKTKPSADTLCNLVRYTDIDARWLLTGEGASPESRNPIINEVNLLLEKLPEESQKEVLKCAQKEKLLSDLLEGKKL